MHACFTGEEAVCGEAREQQGIIQEKQLRSDAVELLSVIHGLPASEHSAMIMFSVCFVHGENWDARASRLHAWMPTKYQLQGAQRCMRFKALCLDFHNAWTRCPSAAALPAWSTAALPATSCHDWSYQNSRETR
jgi:hypothetical protein